jgi:predicted dehydrogenase
MSGPLRVGIAGYGVVGRRRREHIDAHPHLTTVAVSDQNFTDDGAEIDGVRTYSDYTGLCDENLDILFVCMTNDVNPDATIGGLERGLHVFCEKPPGRTVEDVTRVIAGERNNPGLKLKYGFNHRYHDSVRKALKVVESGELGGVINLRGLYGKSQLVTFDQTSWRTDRELAGGGVLLDQGIHLVDLLRLFAGEFVDIHSFVSNGHWNHRVEDNAYALMRTADGKVAMLHSSATQWRHRFSIEITLENGAVILSGILSGSKSYGDETLTIVRAGDDDRGDPIEETHTFEHDPSWSDEIADFADTVVNDKPIVNGSSMDALRTMELVYQIYCADASWRDKWGLKVSC